MPSLSWKGKLLTTFRRPTTEGLPGRARSSTPGFTGIVLQLWRPMHGRVLELVRLSMAPVSMAETGSTAKAATCVGMALPAPSNCSPRALGIQHGTSHRRPRFGPQGVMAQWRRQQQQQSGPNPHQLRAMRRREEAIRRRQGGGKRMVDPLDPGGDPGGGGGGAPSASAAGKQYMSPGDVLRHNKANKVTGPGLHRRTPRTQRWLPFRVHATTRRGLTHAPATRPTGELTGADALKARAIAQAESQKAMSAARNQMGGSASAGSTHAAAPQMMPRVVAKKKKKRVCLWESTN